MQPRWSQAGANSVTLIRVDLGWRFWVQDDAHMEPRWIQIRLRWVEKSARYNQSGAKMEPTTLERLDFRVTSLGPRYVYIYIYIERERQIDRYEYGLVYTHWCLWSHLLGVAPQRTLRCAWYSDTPSSMIWKYQWKSFSYFKSKYTSHGPLKILGHPSNMMKIRSELGSKRGSNP